MELFPHKLDVTKLKKEIDDDFVNLMKESYTYGFDYIINDFRGPLDYILERTNLIFFKDQEDVLLLKLKFDL
jgi:hypothetical protein